MIYSPEHYSFIWSKEIVPIMIESLTETVAPTANDNKSYAIYMDW